MHRSLVFLLIFSFSQIIWASQVLPHPGLRGRDRSLVGEWVYLKGYCQDWSRQTRTKYAERLRNKMYVEHLFINFWDIKFMQSQVDPETPKRPYDFCQRDIYFRPLSTGGAVWLTSMEITYINHCSVESVLDEGLRDVNMEFAIEAVGSTQFLRAHYYNWPGCGAAPFVAFYRSK